MKCGPIESTTMCSAWMRFARSKTSFSFFVVTFTTSSSVSSASLRLEPRRLDDARVSRDVGLQLRTELLGGTADRPHRELGKTLNHVRLLEHDVYFAVQLDDHVTRCLCGREHAGATVHLVLRDAR